MIYICDGVSHVTPEQLKYACSLVSSNRRERAARYRFVSDRIQSVFAFLLLQYAAKKEYTIDEPLQLDYSEGKPKAIGFEHLQFNLSHCKLAVACALSAGPVGVDVQDWTRGRFSTRKRVCCQQELAYLETAKEPEVEFAKLWSRKESYGKFTGQGILYPMREHCLLEQSPCGTVMETFVFDGYALSYCAEEALEIRMVSIEDLFR